MRLSLALVLLSSLLTTVEANAADTDAEILSQITALESARRIERSSWSTILAKAKHSPDLMSAAVRSMGRIQSLSLIGLIESHLSHSSSTVRAASAFAIGQTPGASTSLLFKHLDSEAEDSVRTRLLEAVGKIGSIGDLQLLLPWTQKGTYEERAQALISMAKLISRNATRDLSVTDKILNTSPQASDPLNYRYAWAYLALRATSVRTDALLKSLDDCIRDKAPLVRMVCARALGRFGARSATQREQVSQDDDWRVLLAGIKADRAAGDSQSIERRLVALSDTLKDGNFNPAAASFHLSMSVFEAALKMPKDAINESTAKLVYQSTTLRTDHTEVPRRALLNCAAAALLDRRRAQLRETVRCGGSSYSAPQRERWIVRATSGLGPKKRSKRLKRLFNTFSIGGQLAVLGALTERSSDKSTQAILIRALRDDNPVLVGAAADAIGRLKVTSLSVDLLAAYRAVYGKRDFAAVQSIFNALGILVAEESHSVLKRHTDDSHPGVRQAARRALAKVDQAIRDRLMNSGGSASFLPGRRISLPPPAETFDRSEIDLTLIEQTRVTHAVLETSRGNVVIQLFRASARETVKNFVRLTKRGFFKDVSFHRVLPGFMVQTGDPTGTGWGGPGFTIPCEINQNRFDAGVVGMALDGKDTGGSQFFITVTRAPHLDGHHTAFGRVIEGMDVVTSLAEDDQIRGVELRSSR